MRLLGLYLRARRVPAAAVSVLAGAAVVWLLGIPVSEPSSRLPLAVLGLTIGAAAIAPGLVGSDPDLDRAASIAWPPRRIAHLLLGAAAVAVAVAGSP